MDDQILLALTLTFFAGLSTTIGGLLCLIIGKETSEKMGIALSLTAGVMLYVSIMELLPEGQSLLSSSAAQFGLFAAIHFLLIGALVVYFIEKKHNHSQEHSHVDKRFVTSGLFIIISITLHNLPEGMATLAATLADTKLGLVSALAIAVHNIPEGLAVAIPVYKLTGSYPKAVLAAFGSGMAEPLGALIGLSILNPFLSDGVLGAVLCGVAGVMIYISVVQILPLARTMTKPSVILSSAVIGSMLMAGSLAVL